MSRPFSLSTYNNLLKSVRRTRGRLSGLTIFLDFDGTLTPIAGHPADASLSKSMCETLSSLAALHRVVIITGRGLSDIMKLVPIHGVSFVGNHGMEMSSGDFSFIYDIGQIETRAISELAGLINRFVASYDGAVLEEKTLTLSVHHRFVSKRRLPEFLRRLGTIIGPFNDKRLIKITYGKGLVEIRPTADWDKGSAVGWLMDRREFKGTIPLCIGDDETDEDAFRVVKGVGLSIFVGRRKSVADLFLPTQSEVEPMLAKL